MRQPATAVSKILNPLSTSLITIVVVILVQQIPDNQKMLWIILGFILALAPSLVLYIQYKRGLIANLWSPSAKERQLSYLFWSLFSVVFVALAFWFEAPRSIFALALVFLSLGIINVLLTTSFKISIHSEMLTLLVIVGMLSISLEFIFLAILIPIVGWARIYLKHHTLSEVTYGSLLTILVVYFVFSFFGLATF